MAGEAFRMRRHASVARAPAGRTGPGVSPRQNAVDPGFHGVPVGPAHQYGDADGVDV